MVGNRPNKQTDVGAIPPDWASERISDAAGNSANAIVGGPFGSDLVSADYVVSGVPVIRGQNMAGAVVSGDFAFVSPQKANSLSANLAHPGDLVFTQRGTLGQVAIVPDGGHRRYLVSQSQMKVTLNRARHDPWFVHQYFASRAGQKQIALSAIQTGVPHTNLGILRAYRFPAPPLPEQRAIAETLSDVDVLLAGLDRLIAKKRDLKQAAMQQLLTGQTRLPGFQGEWEAKLLGSAGKCLRGVSYNGDADLSTHDTATTKRLLRSNNVQSATVVTNDVQYVNAARVSPSQILGNGDILICTANGSKALVGKAGRFDLNDGYEYTFGAFMGCFRTSPADADPAFVFYLLQTGRYRDFVNDLLAGSSINNLKPSSIESLEFAFPTLHEQTAIATVLSDLDAELTALEARRAKIRALKQGVMQELLTGKIRLVKPLRSEGAKGVEA